MTLRLDAHREVDLLRAFHRVSDMLPEYETVWADSDDPLSISLRTMNEHDYSQLPVRNSTGNVIGLLSFRSIARRMPALAKDDLDILTDIPTDEFMDDVGSLLFADLGD